MCSPSAHPSSVPTFLLPDLLFPPTANYIPHNTYNLPDVVRSHRLVVQQLLPPNPHVRSSSEGLLWGFGHPSVLCGSVLWAPGSVFFRAIQRASTRLIPLLEWKSDRHRRESLSGLASMHFCMRYIGTCVCVCVFVYARQVRCESVSASVWWTLESQAHRLSVPDTCRAYCSRSEGLQSSAHQLSLSSQTYSLGPHVPLGCMMGGILSCSCLSFVAMAAVCGHTGALSSLLPEKSENFRGLQRDELSAFGTILENGPQHHEAHHSKTHRRE